jgi:hypothetical protein
MVTLRLSVLTISLMLISASFDSQVVLGQTTELGAEPSPASKDAILLLRDLLLQNKKLDSKQKDRLQAIKPGSPELAELAKKFEKKYVAENSCKSGEVCLSSDTLASFQRAYKSKKASNSEVTIDLRKPAERRSALLALQFAEDAQKIDPSSETGYPWCLLTGNC